MMARYFDETTVFVVSGPDFPAVIVNDRDEAHDYERELAELLREHGPEAMNVYVQAADGTLELLEHGTVLCGVDDLAKYYQTTYTSNATGLLAVVGWDT